MKGYITCPTCNGNRRTGTCETCKGTKSMRCPTCKGTGKLPERKADLKPQPTEAEQRLNLAEMYVRNGMTAEALEILRSIVEDFPNTAAAKEAKEQLKGL